MYNLQDTILQATDRRVYYYDITFTVAALGVP